MNLKDALSLPSAELRVYIRQYWKDCPKGHYTTMGVLLSRVKQEKSAQAWSYPRYSRYLVMELDIIPPSIANIWTGIVHKLEHFYGFSVEEMEDLEKRVPQQLMAMSLRYAQSREDLEGIWKRANYKSIGWQVVGRQRFIEREARKVAWKNLFFNDQEAVLLEEITGFIRTRYGLGTSETRRDKIVVILALVYRALIESWPREVNERLRQDLGKFNLPVEIADIESAVFKTPNNEKLGQLAEELVRKRGQ